MQYSDREPIRFTPLLDSEQYCQTIPLLQMVATFHRCVLRKKLYYISPHSEKKFSSWRTIIVMNVWYYHNYNRFQLLAIICIRYHLLESNIYIICSSAAPVPDSGRPAEIAPRPPPAAAAARPVTPVFTSNGKYRSDGRCGAEAPLEGGGTAECDPNSEYWCCSAHGFCGGSQVLYYSAVKITYILQDQRITMFYTFPLILLSAGDFVCLVRSDFTI